MKDIYPSLYYCFSCFPAITEQDFNEHRNFFYLCVKNDYVNVSETRYEIETFDKNNESWVQIAKESNSIFYSEDRTDEDIKVIFQLQTWDILFPEKILSTIKLKDLKLKVVDFLTSTEERKAMNIDDIIWELEDNYDAPYGLTRFDLLYMQKEVAKYEIKVEYFVPECWFFELC